MKILIKNAFIVTQNKKREQISRGFVVIKNDVFDKVAAGNPSGKDISGANKIIDAEKMIILPGLVNAHVHLGESIFKDFFTGKYNLEHYLKVTEKLTQKTNLIERERKIIADYSLLNLIKSGTTTICGGRTTDLAEDWGIRNISGYMLMNSFKLKNYLINIEEKFKKEYRKIKKTKLSYPALFIHSLNTINPKLLEGVKKILSEYSDLKLILHIAETKKQEKDIQNKFGKSSIGFLSSKSLLNNRTILIHGNWIGNSDMKLVKKKKASVVHCLSSNLRVADRTLNLKKMIKESIALCIATDGLITSGTFSVLDEAAKCFAYHNRNQNKYGGLISWQKILDLITIDAARVLGLNDDIGSIEKGKKADIIFIRKEKNNSNVIREIIKGKHRVSGVVIDGKVKMWNNRLLMKDRRKVENKFRTLTKRIKEETR